METMLHVGASKDAIVEAKKAILAILGTKAADAPLVEALKTLSTLCAVTHTTVQYCTFDSTGVKRSRKGAKSDRTDKN